MTSEMNEGICMYLVRLLAPFITKDSRTDRAPAPYTDSLDAVEIMTPNMP